MKNDVFDTSYPCMKNQYIDIFNSRKTLQVFIKAFVMFKWALKDFIYGSPREKCPPSRIRISLGYLVNIIYISTEVYRRIYMAKLFHWRIYFLYRLIFMRVKCNFFIQVKIGMRLFVDSHDLCMLVANLKLFWRSNRTISSLQHAQNKGINKQSHAIFWVR